jgi:hypothetical protein
MRVTSRAAVGSRAVRLTNLVVLVLLVGLIALGGVVVGASATPSPAPQPAACAGVVCSVAPLAEGRSGHSATRLGDGTVLIIGGGTQFWSVLPLTAELWDPATERFRPAGSLAVGRHGHSATLLADGRILVAGGYATPNGDADVILTSAEVWDPRTETFSTTGSLNLARANPGAALLPDGRVIVFGGQSGPEGMTDTSEIWDPVTGAFSPGPALGEARGSLDAVRLEDGRVLAVGGTLDYPATAEVLDPASMVFGPTGSLSVRGDFRATLLSGGRVLVVGGNGSRRGTDAEIWDPTTGIWSAAGSPAGSYSSYHTQTLLDDGRVLVISGAAEAWDPATSAFGAVGPSLPAVGQQTATLLEDGRVLVVGGQAGALDQHQVFAGTADALADASIWDPRSVPGPLVTASPAP